MTIKIVEILDLTTKWAISYVTLSLGKNLIIQIHVPIPWQWLTVVVGHFSDNTICALREGWLLQPCHIPELDLTQFFYFIVWDLFKSKMIFTYIFYYITNYEW